MLLNPAGCIAAFIALGPRNRPAPARSAIEFASNRTRPAPLPGDAGTITCQPAGIHCSDLANSVECDADAVGQLFAVADAGRIEIHPPCVRHDLIDGQLPVGPTGRERFIERELAGGMAELSRGEIISNFAILRDEEREMIRCGVRGLPASRVLRRCDADLGLTQAAPRSLEGSQRRPDYSADR